MKKVAIVTGGSRGIGYSIAQNLCNENYFVYIIGKKDRSEKELASFGLKKFCYHSSDVASYSSLKEILTKIIRKHNRVDVLVNSAGITEDKKMNFMTEKSWNDVIKTNLNGTFWTIKIVSKQMIKQRSGVVVNISSATTKKAALGQSNYMSSKAGVEALTRAAALELARYNIRVNSVSPGYIDTEMTDRIDKGKLIDIIPLRRFGKPKDVAELVSFLISKKSSYITGQNFVVDGGLTL